MRFLGIFHSGIDASTEPDGPVYYKLFSEDRKETGGGTLDAERYFLDFGPIKIRETAGAWLVRFRERKHVRMTDPTVTCEWCGLIQVPEAAHTCPVAP